MINTGNLGEDTQGTISSFAVEMVWFDGCFISNRFDTEKIIMFNYQMSTFLLT